MNEFLSGALSALSGVAGLFFLRYWRLTRDRLFLFFAFAFWLMTLNWIGLAAWQPAVEAQHRIYLVRLLAFALIIWGILDKNRRHGRGSS
jgi:hypothetical protein